jgi:hypothetical protein
LCQACGGDTVQVTRPPLPGRYDLAHLQAFHRYILGDVYDWAGQLRTVSIAKGSVFCLPQHLESYAADVFGRLAAAERLRGLARDPFITGLAGFLADVNALHPFREGNGRPSGRSSPSSPMTPGITSPGCAWTLTATWPPAPPPITATWPRSGQCSTSRPTCRTPPGRQARPADPQPDFPLHGRCRSPAAAGTQPGKDPTTPATLTRDPPATSVPARVNPDLPAEPVC